MFNHRKTWVLRATNDEDGDEGWYDIYDSYEEFFSITLHYEGSFPLNPLRYYKDGKVRTIDCISADYFNMTDLDVIAMGAGYKHKDICLYLWRMPEATFDNGLRPLQTDADIKEFLSHALEFRFMEVYMDSTPLLSLCMLGEVVVPSTANIEEIDDGMESIPSTYDSDSVEDFSDEYNSEDNYIGEEEEEVLPPDEDHDIWEGYNLDDQDGLDDVDLMEPHGDGFVVAQVEASGTPVRDELVRDEVRGDPVIDEVRVDPMLVDQNEFAYGASSMGSKETPIYTTAAILADLLRSSDEEDELPEEGLTQVAAAAEETDLVNNNDVVEGSKTQALRKLKGKSIAS